MAWPAHPRSVDVRQRMFLMLQGCKRSRQLAQLHAQILVNGLSQKKFLIAKLLSSCFASGDLAHASRAFRQVEQPTTTLFNLMIRAYSRTGSTALLLHNQMRRGGTTTQPNGFTYSSLLNACARPSLLSQGEQLHARIVSSGFISNVFVQTSLVGMYAGAGKDAMQRAQRVFDDMPQRNVVSRNSMLAGYMRCGDVTSAFRLFDDMPERNVVSWTTMIAGCAQTGKCRRALSLFHKMRKARVSADQVTMVAALSACADLGDLELGRRLHARIDRGGLLVGSQLQGRLVSLDNSLIHMYVKCGDVEEAHRVFRGMQQRSTVTWTTMIAGFAMYGRGEDALGLFRDMQILEAKNEKPDSVTYIAVLYACSHMGRIDEGHHYFKHMTEVYGIMPRMEHYGCMVDMLSRAGRLSEARQLIEDMPMRPNNIVWGALLGGCRMHQDTALATYVATRLIELHPDQAANYLVLLSSIYAAAKMWDDARTVREKLLEMGVSKPVGRSWILVNGAIHDLVVGDCTHHQAPAIHRMVSDIASRARLQGYFLDTLQVLQNLDVMEEREAFLHLHSEKLAMAFD